MVLHCLIKILFLASLINCLICQTTSSPSDLNIWPKPNSYTQGNTTINISSQSTLIFNVLSSQATTAQEQYIMQLINIYKGIIFNQTSIDFQIYMNGIEIQKSEKASIEQHLLTVSINNPNTMISEQVQDEQYNISITPNTTWYLNCSTYAAFSRAIETFSQLITYNVSQGIWQIVSTPITINDQPAFFYRSIMLDTARHYLSVQTLLNAIDGIMYNKLNTLHWHISDAESFPWVLNSYPNLTAYAIYNSTSHYTSADVKQILEYAKIRGVRVVPEIDSPGHTYCWGKSPELVNITLLCDHLGDGQLDPTLDLTWQVVTGVLTDLNSTFPDSLVHFGGDEVEGWCWNKRPSIASWMAAHNMTEHSQLELYYKQREKQIWKSLSHRDVIYWANANLNLQSEPSDIIQWWGTTEQLSNIENMTNRIILSNNKELYINFFNITWENVFNFTPIVTGIKGTIIGAEATLWAELNDDYTTEEKLWVRATALSERLWNTATKTTSTFADIVKRINGAQIRMTQRGLKPRPCEKQLCASDPYFCYGIATFQECTSDPWCYRNTVLNDDNQEALFKLKEQNLLLSYLVKPEKNKKS